MRWERIEQRRFRAVIDRRVGLEAIRDAYAYAASGEKTGNIVLDLSKT